jgi:trans-aconitate methyltransferase
MTQERDRTTGIDWSPYHESHRGREPRPMLLDALAVIGPGSGRHAVELGCGDGADSLRLLVEGWRVTAVDAGPTGLAMLREDAGDHPALTTVLATLEEYDPPPCDLLYAAYALPFCASAAFPAAWGRFRAALRPGGRMVVNLFGDRDSWAADPDDMVFVTEAQARELLVGLEVERFHEVEQDGPSGRGPKHWHEFQVVARRPATEPG